MRTGGRRPDTGLPGWFYEPTVLTSADREARIEHEEIFGPVVTSSRSATRTRRVRLANDSSFGLGASVWTRDLERAQRLVAAPGGGVGLGRTTLRYSYGDGQASWGGVKESGFGRTHSKHGLYELSQVKFVDLDRGRVPAPWWFPYDQGVVDGFAGALECSTARACRESGARLGAPTRAVAARPAIPSRMSELSHVDESGEVRMVDVGGKPLSRRRAVARAVLRMAPETAAQLRVAAEGRRARDRAARRDHGGEADEPT